MHVQEDFFKANTTRDFMRLLHMKRNPKCNYVKCFIA